MFAIFIVVTHDQIDLSLLGPSTCPPAVDMISRAARTFFAYLGFAVISFTGGELADPTRNLPRATYPALGITTALYMLISVRVFGTLTVEEVIANGHLCGTRRPSQRWARPAS